VKGKKGKELYLPHREKKELQIEKDGCLYRCEGAETSSSNSKKTAVFLKG
jgi:hypothetical protein